MKIQVSAEGVRVRLTYRELEQLPKQPVVLMCGNFRWTLMVDEVTLLGGWPADTLLRLGRKDFGDLAAEPENGIVLADVVPRVVVEVDKRDKR